MNIGRYPATMLAVVGVVLALTGSGIWLAANPSPATQDLQFVEVSEQRGLDYSSDGLRTSGGNGRQGVFVNDYDNDGWEDVLVLGGRPSIRLYENVGGRFSRADALPMRSPAMSTRFKSALFFDYDDDGWEDLLLLPSGSDPVLLRNDHGEFAVADAGLDMELAYPLGATTLDYNRDGCLDLFVIQSGDWHDRTPKGYNDPTADIARDNGNPNVLYGGDCERFERVSGFPGGSHWSLATSAVDVTGDGYPDIHVANDYYNNVMYLNQRNGTFHRVRLGSNTDRNGMSSEVTDVSGDGKADIFVTNIHLSAENATNEGFKRYIEHRIGKRAEGNVLLVNTNNGTFADGADRYGVRKGGWGWAAVSADFDNDGDRDLFHGTQALSGMASRQYVALATPNIWQREGGQFHRKNATVLGFQPSDDRGVASLDYDRDGDQDLILADRDGPFRLYENRQRGGHWLQIRIEGDDGSHAIGSRAYVTVNGTTQVRVLNAKSDFLSQDTRLLHVGLNGHASVERLRVVWPDGTERTFTDVAVDRRIVVTRDGLESVENPSDCLLDGDLLSVC